jgi:PAS domain S-box-containing protein
VVGEGGSGADAIDLAARHQPDVLLLDLSMPGMGGLEALPKVLAAAARTKVVIYTGLEDGELAERARDQGAVGFIPKTVPVSQLADRIDQAVGTPATSRPSRDQARDEALFRMLVEGVGDYAIFMLDPGGHIASWNLGAQRIKGYPAEEALGRHFRMFYPSDAQRAQRPEWELEVASRDGSYEEEGWRVRKDGSRFRANVVITAIRDEAGELVGFAKVTRDITERYAMLQERERAAAELAEANEQLAAANRKLLATAGDMTQFLAVTAHELRTPIRVVTGAADVLAGHWTDLADDERAELLDSMRTSAARMRRLLDDLLTAARLESGAIEIRSRQTPVRPLLQDTVAQALAAHPGLAVEVDCDPQVSAQADPERLGQMVSNYLTNAARYGAPPVRVVARETDGWVLVEVCDRGPGVPAGLGPGLYEKFARGPEDRGTGLGLFIVRQLARAHGGDAWYERREGETRFVVRLPAARSLPESPHRAG